MTSNVGVTGVVELVVSLHSFVNVELRDQGWYAIRVRVRPHPAIKAVLPYLPSLHTRGAGDASCDTAAAGGVEAGWSWRSKAFQIKYCQEEQELGAAPCFQVFTRGVSCLPDLSLHVDLELLWHETHSAPGLVESQLRPVAVDGLRLAGAALGCAAYHQATWGVAYLGMCHVVLVSSLTGFATREELRRLCSLLGRDLRRPLGPGPFAPPRRSAPPPARSTPSHPHAAAPREEAATATAAAPGGGSSSPGAGARRGTHASLWPLVKDLLGGQEGGGGEGGGGGGGGFWARAVAGLRAVGGRQEREQGQGHGQGQGVRLGERQGKEHGEVAPGLEGLQPAAPAAPPAPGAHCTPSPLFLGCMGDEGGVSLPTPLPPPLPPRSPRSPSQLLLLGASPAPPPPRLSLWASSGGDWQAVGPTWDGRASPCTLMHGSSSHPDPPDSSSSVGASSSWLGGGPPSRASSQDLSNRQLLSPPPPPGVKAGGGGWVRCPSLPPAPTLAAQGGAAGGEREAGAGGEGGGVGGCRGSLTPRQLLAGLKPGSMTRLPQLREVLQRRRAVEVQLGGGLPGALAPRLSALGQLLHASLAPQLDVSQAPQVTGARRGPVSPHRPPASAAPAPAPAPGPGPPSSPLHLLYASMAGPAREAGLRLRRFLRGLPPACFQPQSFEALQVMMTGLPPAAHSALLPTTTAACPPAAACPCTPHPGPGSGPLLPGQAARASLSNPSFTYPLPAPARCPYPPTTHNCNSCNGILQPPPPPSLPPSIPPPTSGNLAGASALTPMLILLTHLHPPSRPRSHPTAPTSSQVCATAADPQIKPHQALTRITPGGTPPHPPPQPGREGQQPGQGCPPTPTPTPTCCPPTSRENASSTCPGTPLGAGGGTRYAPPAAKPSPSPTPSPGVRVPRSPLAVRLLRHWPASLMSRGGGEGPSELPSPSAAAAADAAEDPCLRSAPMPPLQPPIPAGPTRSQPPSTATPNPPPQIQPPPEERDSSSRGSGGRSTLDGLVLVPWEEVEAAVGGWAEVPDAHGFRARLPPEPSSGEAVQYLEAVLQRLRLATAADWNMVQWLLSTSGLQLHRHMRCCWELQQPEVAAAWVVHDPLAQTPSQLAAAAAQRRLQLQATSRPGLRCTTTPVQRRLWWQHAAEQPVLVVDDSLWQAARPWPTSPTPSPTATRLVSPRPTSPGTKSGQKEGVGAHVVVFVHGYAGAPADLTQIKGHLHLVYPHLECYDSKANEGMTHDSLEAMGERLAQELSSWLLPWLRPGCRRPLSHLSFVGHSMGCLIIRYALAHPKLVSVLPKLHLFLSICGPHLGQLYSGNSLLQIGAGFITAFTKGKCLSELSLSDAASLRSTSLYRLTLGGQDKGSALQRFRSVVLVASQQDRYVPHHSARLAPCSAARACSTKGQVMAEMLAANLKGFGEGKCSLLRVDVDFSGWRAGGVTGGVTGGGNTPATVISDVIGRTAHIAFLQSEAFAHMLVWGVVHRHELITPGLSPAWL